MIVISHSTWLPHPYMVYGINPSEVFFSRTKWQVTLSLSMKHWYTSSLTKFLFIWWCLDDLWPCSEKVKFTSQCIDIGELYKSSYFKYYWRLRKDIWYVSRFSGEWYRTILILLFWYFPSISPLTRLAWRKMCEINRRSCKTQINWRENTVHKQLEQKHQFRT